MSAEVVRELTERFEAELGRPVELVLTRNRSSLVTWRIDPQGRLLLRMHREFARLDPAEFATIADLVRARPGSRSAMQRLIAGRSEALREDFATRTPTLDACGQVHDLTSIRDELLADLFPDLSAPPIGWSGRPGRARRRLRLGSWDSRTGVVRIHRSLDVAEVPRYFVASVVNHELCHAALGEPKIVAGRRRLHGPDFRALEARFAEHSRATAWEAEHRELLFAG